MGEKIITIDGVEYIKNYPGNYTEESDNEIRDTLKGNYDKEKIDRFMELLYFHIHRSYILSKQPTIKDYNTDHKQIVDSLNKSLKHLSNISNHKFDLTINLQFGSEVKDLQEILDLAKDAQKSIELFQEKFSKCKIENTGKGRPKADAKDIVYNLAFMYFYYLEDMPTNYSNGTFYKIVKIVLKGIGLPYKDPRKKVEQAILKLNENEYLDEYLSLWNKPESELTSEEKRLIKTNKPLMQCENSDFSTEL